MSVLYIYYIKGRDKEWWWLHMKLLRPSDGDICNHHLTLSSHRVGLPWHSSQFHINTWNIPTSLHWLYRYTVSTVRGVIISAWSTGISCLLLCLYGIRAPYDRSFLCMEAWKSWHSNTMIKIQPEQSLHSPHSSTNESGPRCIRST